MNGKGKELTTAERDVSGHSNHNSSTRARILRNVIFNWSGVVVGMAAGLITVPILITRLGDTLYGIWIIIGALTGYFSFLDFGVRGAVGRYVAFYDAKHDYQKLSRMVSTALVMLGVAAFLTLIGGGVLAFAFERFIKDIPPNQIYDVRQAILVVSVGLALFFVLRAFDAFLWGVQRFDLLNMVDIPTTLARLALTVLLVKSAGGIIMLAWIMLVTNFGSGLAKMWLSFRERPALQIGLSLFDARHVRELYGFGLWQFVGSIAQLSSKSFVPAVIGATLGAIAVVPYSLAIRLVDVASQFAMTATGVVSPVSTLLHAKQDTRVQRNLLIVATQYCSCLSFFFTAGFVLLGRETITLWVGREYAEASRYLTILAVGCMLPFAFGVTDSILVGLGKPRIASLLTVGTASISISAAVIFGRQGNLTHLCLAIAAATTLFHGIARPIIVAKLIGLAPAELLSKGLVPAAAVSAPPIVFLFFAVKIHSPDSLTWLAGQAALFGLLAAVCVGIGIDGSATALRRCFVSAK